MNGTCNYILTLMANGIEFDNALKKAQELGFAEADPTLDINGMDTAHKVSVLSKDCFDFDSKVENFHVTGLKIFQK